jgi:hypothetical protein
MLNGLVRSVLVCGAALSLGASGCGSDGGQGGTSVSPPPTRGGVEPHIARGSDLVRACPAIYGRAIALIRGASPAAVGPLRRDQVRSVGYSSCRIGTRRPNGITVHVTLDTAPHVLQGYANRLVESQQFGQETTKGLSPVPVAGLGDRRVGGGGANWIPALNQLLSVRGHHMLAVNVFAHGVPRRERLGIAKRLALRAWARLGVPRR